MADYDGTNWGRIDESAAAPENAFDVFLTRSLEANSEWLAKGNEVVSATMLGSTSAPDDPPAGSEPYPGDKPWVSYDWACHYIMPIRLGPEDESVEVNLWASIFGGSVDYLVELASEITGGERLATTDGTWTAQTIEDQGHLSAQVDLDTPVGATRWAILRVWTRSRERAASAAQTTSSSTGIIGYRIIDVSSDPSLPGLRPQLASTGVASIRFSDSDGGGEYDVIAIDTVSTNKRLFLEPGLHSSYGASVTFTYRYLSMAQVRSIGIRMIRRDNAFGGTLKATQAKKSPRGRIAIRQAYRYQKLYAAEKLLAHGPTGHVAPVNEETAGLPRKWRIVVADAASGNPSKVLDECVRLKRTGGQLKVAMLVSSHYHGNHPETPSWSEWNFTLALQKSSGTGWVNVETEITEAKNLTTHITNYAAYRGTPLSMQRRAEIMDVNTVRTTRLMSTREGALFQDDMGQLQFVEMVIDCDSATNPEDESLRVLVTADYTGNTGITANSTTAAGLGDLLDLTCYGYAIYQE